MAEALEVAAGVGQVGVAELADDGGDGDAGAVEVGGVGVAQSVGVDAFVDPGSCGEAGEGGPDLLGVEGGAGEGAEQRPAPSDAEVGSSVEPAADGGGGARVDADGAGLVALTPEDPDGAPVEVDVFGVEGEGFPDAQAPALQGEDERPGANNLAVLSYRYWLARFHADPEAINENIIVNGQSMMVVGVTPAGYVGTTLEDDPKIYVPVSLAALMIPGWNGFEDRRDHWLYLFARLNPGLSRDAAER